VRSVLEPCNHAWPTITPSVPLTLCVRGWVWVCGGAGRGAGVRTVGAGTRRWRRGESFLRVHWVAVPEELRARRVNRLQDTHAAEMSTLRETVEQLRARLSEASDHLGERAAQQVPNTLSGKPTPFPGNPTPFRPPTAGWAAESMPISASCCAGGRDGGGPSTAAAVASAGTTTDYHLSVVRRPPAPPPTRDGSGRPALRAATRIA
jgi:hypothetical protein